MYDEIKKLGCGRGEGGVEQRNGGKARRGGGGWDGRGRTDGCNNYVSPRYSEHLTLLTAESTPEVFLIWFIAYLAPGAWCPVTDAWCAAQRLYTYSRALVTPVISYAGVVVVFLFRELCSSMVEQKKKYIYIRYQPPRGEQKITRANELIVFASPRAPLPHAAQLSATHSGAKNRISRT